MIQPHLTVEEISLRMKESTDASPIRFPAGRRKKSAHNYLHNAIVNTAMFMPPSARIQETCVR